MIFAVSWYVVNCMDMVLKQFSKCVSHPISGIRAIQYVMFNVYRDSCASSNGRVNFVSFFRRES